MSMRIGYGYDSHEFRAGVPLMIGGVRLEHTHGLAGHSDGDVLLHAITDALLGAVGVGDIGSFFPPGDPQWKGANSVLFLEEAMRQIEMAGFRVVNIDTTMIMAAPKIVPHAEKLRARVAELLKTVPARVGIKAKTPEGTGTDNAAIAHAVVLLESIPLEPLLEEQAVAVSMKEEDAVSELIDGNGNGRH
ncbi:MAG TPA: 2-C-methyl-D-erythritol 2,4-cyclodiphosphate synthase [Candidatus Saccharimonadales bacterium]|nr:2-C-methyl-D-erythritol 2,4-cyclodiphosphate synthase [Candidatus Saccharimonadales bacterium]